MSLLLLDNVMLGQWHKYKQLIESKIEEKRRFYRTFVTVITNRDKDLIAFLVNVLSND
jgi:hypothetical protein